jgi:hypothetical protein
MVKRITIICIIGFFAIQNAFATNGIEKFKLQSTIELKQIGNGIVQITGSLICDATEYFELERSTDNKNFTTASVIFAVTDKDSFTSAVVLKDKVKENTKTVYYRLKKVSGGNKVIYYAACSIQLTK